MTGLQEFAAAVGALVLIVTAVPTLRHAAWTVLCVPARINDILTKLDSFDEVTASNERAVAASERALDEWRGATEAVKELAGDHTHQLADHQRRIVELELWRLKLDGA